MELDALLLFARILENFDFTETELLIIQSYIVNKNININNSIHENVRIFIEENEMSIDECKDLRSIVSESKEYLKIPIYKLMIKNRKLRPFVLQALIKRALDDTSILDIVETILLEVGATEIINNREIIEEQNELTRFLMDFLAKRRFTKKNDMQESRVINEYVKKTEGTVLNENDRFLEGYQIRFFRRMLLYKLFSCGYASFDYNQKLDPESLESGIESIVKPLLESRSYGHLRLMINNATLSSENVEELKNVIKRVFKCLYDDEVTKATAESDAIFIDKVNVFLKSAGSEILDYAEISKSEIGIIL